VTLETVLVRDRWIAAASLAAIAGLAWLYLFHLSAGMDMPPASDMAAPGMEGMPGMARTPGMPAAPPLAASLALTALMWFVMMVGMMTPGAAPTVLIFAALERRRGPDLRPGVRTALFVAGYFAVWAAFSLAAALAQAALQRTDFLSPHLAASSAAVAGAIFVLAGLYELTPLKERCLGHCRSPLDWLARRRRSGRAGAMAMGAEHGAYCLGCCWALMLLLFAAGVMNLLFVALLAVMVLAQKLLPGGRLLTRLTAIALIGCGLALMLRPLVAA
jgi:predicted metal-binding membrane protein